MTQDFNDFFNTAAAAAQQTIAERDAAAVKQREAVSVKAEAERVYKGKEEHLRTLFSSQSELIAVLKALNSMPEKDGKRFNMEVKGFIKKFANDVPCEFSYGVEINYGQSFPIDIKINNSEAIEFTQAVKVQREGIRNPTYEYVTTEYTDMKQVVNEQLAGWIGSVAPDRVDELQQQMAAPRRRLNRTSLLPTPQGSA